MKTKTILLLLCISVFALNAKVPTPPDGKRWVLNAQYSDEFDGDKLDRTKWNNTFDGWKGRKPAIFNPDAISVADGKLRIRSGVLDQATNGYTIYGGAVQSTTTNAHYGYYECNFKASKIPMSTTFWLSNPKKALEEESQKCSNGNYPRYSQELDIQECVGNVTSTKDWTKDFDQSMHSNTHFRIVKCGENKETFYSRGANAKIRSKVYDSYNTYGCWWVDSKHAKFYANDEYFESVDFKTDFTDTPFERPMRINMVTETYDWNPCSKEVYGGDLENMSINTSYYEWIRSWYLVDVNDSLAFSGEMPLDDRITYHRDPSFYDSSRKLKLRYEYEAKKDRLLRIKIIDNAGNLVETIEKKLFAGFGRVKYEEFQTNNNFGGKGTYTMLVEMCDIETGSVLSFIVSDLGEIAASISQTKERAGKVYVNSKKELCISGLGKVEKLKLYNLKGSLLLNDARVMQESIDLSFLNTGMYLVCVDGYTNKIILQ